MRNRYVKELAYNRTVDRDGRDYWSEWSVGENGVTKIVECPAQGEGYRWYYEIYIEGELTYKIFHPSHCEYFTGEELAERKKN